MSSRKAVCLCADRNMIIPALFVAHSISKAAESALPFDTIVFSDPSELTTVHREWASEHGIELCEDLDISPIVDIRLLQNWTTATLMRLLLPGYLADRYDTILYLDSDLTIHGDVPSIFALDTGDFSVAAVPSGRTWTNADRRREFEEHCHALGMTPPYRYFNMGIMLIDVAMWNQQDLGNRAVSFLRQNPDLCFLPDEQALNAVLDGRVAQLSPIWNTPPGLTARDIGDSIIIHYIGPEKPWRRYGYGKRLFRKGIAFRLYESFLADTPWRGWLDQQWTGRDLYKSFVWETERIAGRLSGKLDEPSRQRRAYVEASRQFIAETDFADVAQGITIRDDARIRLKQKWAPVG